MSAPAHRRSDTIDATDLFLDLTPDKVLESVDAAGLVTNPVCYTLNSFENRVYDIELDDRSHVVAKFYRPRRWTTEQILEEHQFLQDCETAEIPVCGVRPFPDGRTLHTVDDHIHYCVFERKGGRAPDELTDAMVERLGMLTARLHNVGVTRDAPNRLRIDADTYIRNNLDWLDEHPNFLPARLRARYFEAAHRIADIADEYMRGVPVHRIHGDLHTGNIIEREGLLHLLDFDDMVVGPAVQDFWLALPGRDPRTTAKRNLFLDAYEQLRTFDRQTLRLIEPLRGLRYVHYAVWIARRWHDPAFPRTWPHFGTDEYWEGETTDLEDLLAVIEGADSALQPSPEEEAKAAETELTNADFFWDWEE